MKNLSSAFSSMFMLGIFSILCFICLLCSFFTFPLNYDFSARFSFVVFEVFFIGLLIILTLVTLYLYKSIKQLNQSSIRKTITITKKYEKDKAMNFILFDFDYFWLRETGLFDFGMKDKMGNEYMITKGQFDEIPEGDKVEIEYFDYSKRVSEIRRL